MIFKKAFWIVLLFIFSGMLGFSLSLYLFTGKKEVETIQTFHYPALFVSQLKHDPKAGEKIYQEFCSACHSEHPRIDISAPHIHDEKVWRSRRTWGKKALLAITIQGRGAMPARGGCFECSDAELEKAIEYLSQP